MLRLKSNVMVFCYDLLMVPIAWYLAYALRYNTTTLPLVQAAQHLPILLLVQSIINWKVGLYRGVWQFTSMHDIQRICKAVALGTFTAALIVFFYTRLVNVPRSIFLLYPLLLIAFLGGSRFLYRRMKESQAWRRGQRVLVVGAGQGGEGLIRALMRERVHHYRPIIVVDDDRSKRGKEIQGIRVAGGTADIPKLVDAHQIELILIAVPSAHSAVMRKIVSHSEEAGIPFYTLPSPNDLALGRVTIDALRKVSLDDLLGRAPVEIDSTHLQGHIENRCLLVTGGGGSIGAELCQQISAFRPRELVVIEHNEFNLYQLEQRLRTEWPALTFTGYLADVTDPIALKTIFSQHAFDIVFHAAAYKHVPMLETQPHAAIKNNLYGTMVVAQTTSEHKVPHFVLISTDKAVNPTNVMGASKRCAELFCQRYNENSSTRFTTVRFGNVLGSTGSVVPHFKAQIAKGGPVTVTHPEMTRFFMTIPEATQLILQASTMGQGGEIFVLDMGEPINIDYLAKQMIRLASLTPNQSIPIEYIGLRPGEKMTEELFYHHEAQQTTLHEKIYCVRSDAVPPLIASIDALIEANEQHDIDTLADLLHQCVPEYGFEISSHKTRQKVTEVVE